MSYVNSKTNPLIFDIIIFIVRLFVGFAMLSHGYPKLQTLIDGGEIKFYDFLGLGPKISLGLTVFAEFICSIFLILGLFTRVAAGFLIFTMAVAAFFVHGADGFDKRNEFTLPFNLFNNNSFRCWKNFSRLYDRKKEKGQ